MVARQMNPAARILLPKFGLPLGALGSLAAQRSIKLHGDSTEIAALETNEPWTNQSSRASGTSEPVSDDRLRFPESAFEVDGTPTVVRRLMLAESRR